MNLYFLVTFLSMLSAGPISCRPGFTKANVEEDRPAKKDQKGIDPVRVKWTWQLPAQVRNSFHQSQFSTWFVEKIIRYRLEEKTIYRFYLDNGNLLDGDHHDSFFKAEALDISADGATLRNSFRNKPDKL